MTKLQAAKSFSATHTVLKLYTAKDLLTLHK